MTLTLPDTKTNVEIPIYRKPGKEEVHLLSSFTYTIKPHSMEMIQAYTDDDLPRMPYIITEGLDPNTTPTDYEVIPTIATQDSSNIYPMLIQNNSKEYIEIAPNTVVGRLDNKSRYDYSTLHINELRNKTQRKLKLLRNQSERQYLRKGHRASRSGRPATTEQVRKLNSPRRPDGTSQNQTPLNTSVTRHAKKYRDS